MHHLKIALSLFFIIQIGLSASAQQPFELRDGDKVVFLGPGIIENEQRYGWLESFLTSLWPDRYVSFRNLGWTGDTVFGEARTYYTSPPTPFELLISQVKNANPTHVFLAYGSVESEMGEEGLEKFSDGLDSLLDSLEKMSTEVVIMSPISLAKQLIPEERQSKLPLEAYQEKVKAAASERKLIHLDLNPLLESLGPDDIEAGTQLKEQGYALMAMYIRKELGFPIPPSSIQVHWKEKGVQTSQDISSMEWEKDNNLFSLSLKDQNLVIPLPGKKESYPKISVTGLKKGHYGLKINGELVAVGSSQDWEKGILLQQGPMIRQSASLGQTIQKKDEIYFRKYRPQNRTYILGFRAYEQGRHEEDLKDLGLLVTWLDGQINQLKQPQPQHLQFFPIQ